MDGFVSKTILANNHSSDLEGLFETSERADLFAGSWMCLVVSTIPAESCRLCFIS